MSPECMLVRVLAGGHLVSGVLSLDILPLPVPAQPAGGPALHLAGEGHQLLARAGVGDVITSYCVGTCDLSTLVAGCRARVRVGPVSRVRLR